MLAASRPRPSTSPRRLWSLKALANASYSQKVDEHNESSQKNMLLRAFLQKVLIDGQHRWPNGVQGCCGSCMYPVRISHFKHTMKDPEE
jgi:hypothetical protein